MRWLVRLWGRLTGRSSGPAAEPARLPVVHYEAEFVPNPSPPGMPFRAFAALYRDLEATSRRFGRVTGGDSPPDPGAHFYLYWGDAHGIDHKYLYLEVTDPAAFTAGWVRAVAAALRRHPGWGVGVQNFTDGCVLVFADRLLVTGQPFAACKTVADVAEAGQVQLLR